MKHPSKRMRPQCDSHAPGNAQTLLEVRSKERTHLPASSHHPAPHPKTRPPTTPERAFIFPLHHVHSVCCSSSPKYPRTRGDDSNNNPTTINPPLGAVHVPINTQDQATALVQILHIIRATRAHGIADWHPKAIEKTLFSNKDHPAPYGDIVIALVKYARDSDKHVPSFIFDALADWAPKGQTAQRTPCEDHAGQDAHTCVCCASDILTGLRPPEYRGRHFDIPDTLETAMSREEK